jgi:hypothetical protein
MSMQSAALAVGIIVGVVTIFKVVQEIKEI